MAAVEYDQYGSRLELAGRFTPGPGAEGAEQLHVEIFGDEADRAVSHGELGSPSW